MSTSRLGCASRLWLSGRLGPMSRVWLMRWLRGTSIGAKFRFITQISGFARMMVVRLVGARMTSS